MSPCILRALLVIAGASADVAAVVPALHVQVISALVEGAPHFRWRCKHLTLV